MASDNTNYDVSVKWATQFTSYYSRSYFAYLGSVAGLWLSIGTCSDLPNMSNTPTNYVGTFVIGMYDLLQRSSFGFG